MSVTVVLAEGLSPDNDEARRWLERELSKPEYSDQSSITDRWWENLENWFADLLSGINGAATPLPGIVAAIVVVLLLVLVIYLLRFVRRTPKAKSASTQSVLGGHRLSAREFRERAEKALAAGDHDACVLDAMRAMARRGFDRTLLADAPSLTAREVAVGLTRHFPDRRERLAAAALLFDAVAYGGRHATADEARGLLDLESEIASARPRSVETEPDAATSGATQ
ncbi:DUF4129 domain-containing protein [Gordonia soli]|uniref:Protein-glutamine gamma-glutamyltransferase-like C-terminal domain-containing protein n=1 Tax=Gordonia soli NBRC 108243 TaxID=1223545 RepID=M0QES8_9ACTN|nr:DUF4129 domain-containing protein [Gordonia soli]GAC66821.1 hypothetical protein GS4_05_00290 [Gordonia soli NBRC 108243]